MCVRVLHGSFGSNGCSFDGSFCCSSGTEHAISGTDIPQAIRKHRSAQSFTLLEKSAFEEVFSA